MIQTVTARLRHLPLIAPQTSLDIAEVGTDEFPNPDVALSHVSIFRSMLVAVRESSKSRLFMHVNNN
jgi:hypothetical protein